jgi:hypothetical protein
MYLIFLQNELPLLLENVLLVKPLHVYLKHDGAPPHFSLQVTDFLHDTYPGHWIDRGGPVA